MAEADEICSKILGTEFKSVPLNERRIKEDEEEVMSDRSIDVMMSRFADLLTLADTIYSACHSEPGTLSD